LEKTRRAQGTCYIHAILEIVPKVWRHLWELDSHKNKKFAMVMNIRSSSQNNRQPRVQLDPVIQSYPQPAPFPPPSGGDQERIAALEAHIKALMRQNTELLLRNME
jgi:hypothetical protein